LDGEIAEEEERLKELTEAYEKLRKLLEQKEYSRRRGPMQAPLMR